MAGGSRIRLPFVCTCHWWFRGSVRSTGAYLKYRAPEGPVIPMPILASPNVQLKGKPACQRIISCWCYPPYLQIRESGCDTWLKLLTSSRFYLTQKTKSLSKTPLSVIPWPPLIGLSPTPLCDPHRLWLACFRDTPGLLLGAATNWTWLTRDAVELLSLSTLRRHLEPRAPSERSGCKVGSCGVGLGRFFRKNGLFWLAWFGDSP